MLTEAQKQELVALAQSLESQGKSQQEVQAAIDSKKAEMLGSNTVKEAISIKCTEKEVIEDLEFIINYFKKHNKKIILTTNILVNKITNNKKLIDYRLKVYNLTKIFAEKNNIEFLDIVDICNDKNNIKDIVHFSNLGIIKMAKYYYLRIEKLCKLYKNNN